MGVASYREDNYQRWLNSQPPLPLVAESSAKFRCPFCDERFETASLRIRHFDDEHRTESPVLLIDGSEVLGAMEVTVPIPKGGAILANCTSVIGSIDGGIWYELSLIAAQELFEGAKNVLIKLRARNQFHERAEPIEREYEVRVCVPDERVLVDIERMFATKFGDGEVSGDSLRQFRDYLPWSAAEGKYGRALASYAQGVLLRDRGFGAARPSAEFKECYTEAGSVLALYSRPLARLVCGLSRFALNDLGTRWSGTGWERLDRVLWAIFGSSVAAEGGGTNEAAPCTVRCPTDAGTDKIVELSENLAGWTAWREFDIRHRKAAILDALDPFDQVKATALYAATALRLGATGHSRPFLEDLLGDSTFGGWAQRQLVDIEAPDAKS